jgi:hypothetical protein
VCGRMNEYVYVCMCVCIVFCISQVARISLLTFFHFSIEIRSLFGQPAICTMCDICVRVCVRVCVCVRTFWMCVHVFIASCICECGVLLNA